MLRYQLFGQTITFDDSAERFFDLQSSAEQARGEISQEFSKWYKQNGNIQSVLNDYRHFAQSILDKLAVQPLFSQLADYGIYDVSQESYQKQCISSVQSTAAFQSVEQQYRAILNQQAEGQQLRAERKAGRSRYRSTTSFHSDYFLRDQAEAGLMNLASFAGHSLRNAVGNAGSALVSSLDKNSLYQSSDTQNILLNGILSDLFSVYQAHMNFINTLKSGCFQNVFDTDKSSALFENAQKLPDKQVDLLLQSFTLCPWNPALVKYIFVHFPSERSDIAAAAQRFCIDLSSNVEEIIAQEYDKQAQSSEDAAQAAKERILAHMRKYGISESQTLNTLETDCLRRLCAGYETADEADCNRLIESVRHYQAQEQLKVPFFELLQKRIDAIWTNEMAEICKGCETADETACEMFLANLKKHKAPQELKAPFLKKVQARIESIWSAEDGEIFDNLYMKTDITDSKAIAEAVAYVQSKGRTASSQKYLDALNGSTPQNIENARLYRHTNRYKIYMILAILCIIPIITLPLTAIFCLKAWSMKKAWNTLTLNSTVIPPALLNPPPSTPKS